MPHRVRGGATASPEALAELDRAKTSFFSNVSHEFRTPLALMLGPTEDLLAGRHGQLAPGPAPSSRCYGATSFACTDSSTVCSISRGSRPAGCRRGTSPWPSRSSPPNRERVPIGDQRGGSSSWSTARPPTRRFTSIPRCGRRSCSNLLSNAFKFTFEGRIAIALRAGDDHVRLRCATPAWACGPRSPAAVQRFHRVEGTRARTHEGSGIGLTLVQELVRLHGGRIPSKARRQGDGVHDSRSQGLGAFRPRTESGRTTVRDPINGAGTFVEEALRWLPDAPVPDALRHRRPDAADAR